MQLTIVLEMKQNKENLTPLVFFMSWPCLTLKSFREQMFNIATSNIAHIQCLEESCILLTRNPDCEEGA